MFEKKFDFFLLLFIFVYLSDILQIIERKMAQTMSATHILEQLWACRERDLLQKISESRDLDFEELKNILTGLEKKNYTINVSDSE